MSKWLEGQQEGAAENMLQENKRLTEQNAKLMPILKSVLERNGGMTHSVIDENDYIFVMRQDFESLEAFYKQALAETEETKP